LVLLKSLRGSPSFKSNGALASSAPQEYERLLAEKEAEMLGLEDYVMELQAKLGAAQEDVRSLLQHEADSKQVLLQAENLVATGQDALPRDVAELQAQLAEKETDVSSLVVEYEKLQEDHEAAQARLRQYQQEKVRSELSHLSETITHKDHEESGPEIVVALRRQIGSMKIELQEERTKLKDSKDQVEALKAELNLLWEAAEPGSPIGAVVTG